MTIIQYFSIKITIIFKEKEGRRIIAFNVLKDKYTKFTKNIFCQNCNKKYNCQNCNKKKKYPGKISFGDFSLILI